MHKIRTATSNRLILLEVDLIAISEKSHVLQKYPRFFGKNVLKLILDKIIHLLLAFMASPYPPGHKQCIHQTKHPNQFVNFWFVDWHFNSKTKSKTLRKF